MIAVLFSMLVFLSGRNVFLPIIANGISTGDVGEAVTIELPPVEDQIGWPMAESCEQSVDQGWNELLWIPAQNQVVMCNPNFSEWPLFGLDLFTYEAEWMAFEDGSFRGHGMNGAGERVEISGCMYPFMGCTAGHMDNTPGYDLEYFEELLSYQGYGSRSINNGMGQSAGWIAYRIVDWEQYDYPVVTKYEVEIQFYGDMEPGVQVDRFWMKVQ